MKRFIISLMVFLTFGLAGCEFSNEPAKPNYQIILDKIDIGFHGNDTFDSITQDIYLPTSVDTTIQYEAIAWTTSDPTTIDANGKVTRKATNQQVSLAVTVTIEGVSHEKLFHLTVLSTSTPSNHVVVIFDSHGGTLIESQYLTVGDKVSKPIDPTKHGYTFKGWYVNDVLYDFNHIVSESLTLTAKWEVIPTQQSYLVTFDTNGGTPISAIRVYENRLIEVSPPSRGDDQFIGWFKDQALTDPWHLNSDVVTEDMTLYAKWAMSEIPFIPGRTLTFNDEFNGTSLDTSKWSFQNGTGTDYGLWFWGNEEKQYYKPDNTEVADGMLKIHAKIEQTYDEPSRTTMHYSSSKLVTQGKFAQTFGRFEARVRVPLAQGFWPAFWLMPEKSVYGGWPYSGEIDIVEWRGRIANEASSAIHFQGANGHQYQYRNYTLPSGQTIDQFHTYAVEWSLGKLEFSVDGYVYHSRVNTWHNAPKPFDQDFFIILNFAIGGMFDQHRMPPIEAFPATMEVDFVRVYQGL